MSNGTPAGWFPDPANPAVNRYWDGTRWADAAAAPTPPVGQAHGLIAPPPPGVTQSEKKDPKKKWMIGGAIAAGVVAIAAIGGALGAGQTEEPTPTVTVTAEAEPTAVSTPEPSADAVPATEETEATDSTPERAAVDPEAFASEANSHLDDILKDLGDIETTIAEDGYFRLLSNSAELSFNISQLTILDVPESVQTKWALALSEMTLSVTAFDQGVADEDKAEMLRQVDELYAQVESARELANSAS